MGELVNLKEYRVWKSKQAEEKKQTEMDETIDELEMLKNVLEGIVKDLPEVAPSIMYVPVEPKLDAFMGKDFKLEDLDGYLLGLGLKIDSDDRQDT